MPFVGGLFFSNVSGLGSRSVPRKPETAGTINGQTRQRTTETASPTGRRQGHARRTGRELCLGSLLWCGTEGGEIVQTDFGCKNACRHQQTHGYFLGLL